MGKHVPFVSILDPLQTTREQKRLFWIITTLIRNDVDNDSKHSLGPRTKNQWNGLRMVASTWWRSGQGSRQDSNGAVHQRTTTWAEDLGGISPYPLRADWLHPCPDQCRETQVSFSSETYNHQWLNWVFSNSRAKKWRCKAGGLGAQPPRSWGFFIVKKTKLRKHFGLWLYFCYTCITLVERVLKSGAQTLIMNWDDRISVCIKKKLLTFF